MIDKAPDAYRTISEAAEELDLPQHVLRFWETRFSQIKPLKRGGGRRYYRPDDVELLKGIRHLLYSEGYTIKGVQRILKEQGPKAVQALMRELIPDEGEPAEAPAAPPPPVPDRREAPRRIEPSLAVPAPAPVPTPPIIAEPLLPPMAVATPQPSAVQPPAVHAAPPRPADDLFSASDIARAMVPPASIPPTAPVAPVPQPPTVSFMRGGLARPPGSAPPAAASEPEPAPAAGINVRRSIRPVPPDDLVEEDVPPPAPVEPPRPAAPRPELTDAGRRALQSALFELSECRRVIERVTATMGRGR